MPFPDVILEHTINRFLLRCQLQWELSACHFYVASTLAHLHCLAIRFYNDFKLFCPNNKIYGISVQPCFFFSFFIFLGKWTYFVLSLHQDCSATLNSLWKFYGSLTILPFRGHFDAKRYEIHSNFFQPMACLCWLPYEMGVHFWEGALSFSGTIWWTVYWGCCFRFQPSSSSAQQTNKNVPFGHGTSSPEQGPSLSGSSEQ